MPGILQHLAHLFGLLRQMDGPPTGFPYQICPFVDVGFASLRSQYQNRPTV